MAYPEQILANALKVLPCDENVSVPGISRLYQVLMRMLYDRLYVARGREGAPTVLTAQEELRHVHHVKRMALVPGPVQDGPAGTRRRADGGPPHAVQWRRSARGTRSRR
jgi:hypothetical protein